MTIQRALPVVLAAVALAASGCGGSKSAGSDTSDATGSVAGTVETIGSTTTAEGSASFDVRWQQVNDDLQSGLKQLENGDAADRLVGAATILETCTDAVTDSLGSRADSTDQQQAVSQLRTACADAAQAAQALKDGDEDSAKSLAETALDELAAANESAK
jgi:hypothetical protein